MKTNMARRDFLRVSAIATGMATLGTATASAARKPNIIYIMADDLGYADVGCFGQKKIKTPFLDQMAAEGMRLTQHYSGSTVCAPSRSCLMTGQHTGHTRVRANGAVPLEPEDVTVAEVMKQAGYTTGIVGKWGLGDPGTTGEPNKQGFDHWFGFLDQSKAHFYYPPYVWRNGEKVEFPENDYKKQVGQYIHDLFTKEALGFIREHKDDPFFLYLPYTIVHAEITVPEDSMEPYKGLWPETPYPGAHYGGNPTPRAARAGMVARLDRDIGRIFALLKELDLDQDTLVIFTSDNGPCEAGGSDWEFFDSNGDLRGIKRDLYEGGVNVPFIARWPGKITPGTVSDHVSAFWDFMPTCAELAGVSTPENIDGISYLPTLLGGDQKEHEYLYWEFFEQGGKQALRMGDWKAVRLNAMQNPNGPLELYDLSKDPAEENNIAAAHPELVSKIAAIMKSARTESPHWAFKPKPKKKK